MKMMGTKKTGRGFSMIELMVSIAIGVLLMGVVTQLFKTAMDATALVSQRAEMQQNVRASIDLISKDINMAGGGIPSGGVQLPTGGGSLASWYGCNQLGTCYLPVHNYPNGNYLYGIIPGAVNGVQGNVNVPATGHKADAITVIYVDYAFPLYQYAVAFPGAPGGANGTVVNLTAPVPAVQAVNSVGGLQVGDLVLLNNNIGSAIGEVTNFTATSITFADLDALRINQSTAGFLGNIRFISNGTPTAAYRLWAVTYYLEVPATGQLPRLMRQVNGKNAVAVADNIIDLQVTYDVFNDATGVATANVKDPTVAPYSPSQIRKVNVVVMGQSLWARGNKSQSLQMATSISARNMSFKNRYN